jgi:hypothetical protein
MTIARRHLGIFALIAVGFLGCAHPYRDAVGSYATVAGDSIKSLSSIPTTAVTICQKRALARYLKLHLNVGTSPLPRWEPYYTVPGGADGTLSWKDYCGDIQATGKNLAALLSLLTTYSTAMKSLASSGAWDGTPVKNVTSSLSNLVGAKTSIGQVLAGLGSPAQQLSVAITAYYADQEIRKFARAADKPIQDLLDGLNRYVIAIETDVVEPARQERVEAIELLETKGNVWTGPLDASRAIGFINYAKSVDDDVLDITSTFASFKTLVAKLKAGHSALAKDQPEKISTSDIVAAVTDIFSALTQVGTAISAKSSNN